MKPKQKKQLLQQVNRKSRTFTEQEMMAFGERIIKSYLAASLITLRDTYGFGRIRLERFLKGESRHAQAIKKGYVTTDEILDQIEKETKFNLQQFIEEQAKEMEE